MDEFFQKSAKFRILDHFIQKLKHIINKCFYPFICIFLSVFFFLQHIYIYIYRERERDIHRQTISLYHNSSVWLDT